VYGPGKVTRLPYARNFRELEVYKKARELAQRVFQISREFPREEQYSLTDQVRRSSRSVGGQIAEAWSKRRYPKHFASKLTDADGEQNETQHWIEIAFDSSYLDAEVRTELIDRCLEIGKMLGSMINKAEGFSGDGGGLLRENAAIYLFEPSPNEQSEH
jgi:four helix bundle protein